MNNVLGGKILRKDAMSGGFKVGTGSAKIIKFTWNAPKELELIT